MRAWGDAWIDSVVRSLAEQPSAREPSLAALATWRSEGIRLTKTGADLLAARGHSWEAGDQRTWMAGGGLTGAGPADWPVRLC